MAILIALILLPLAAIGLQLGLGLAERFGVAGYSLYKLCFLLPPLLYCRRRGIGVRRDILRWRCWRERLPQALGLGLLSILIFWGAYLLLGDRLLDRDLVVAKLGEQFRVSARTVIPIGLFTVFANSLLEEFFYRGFAFGRLVRRRRRLGYLLPAGVFAAHHVLFILPWLEPLPLGIAAGGLFAFALVLSRLYERAGSIVAPWLAHLLADVAMMSIAASLLLG